MPLIAPYVPPGHGGAVAATATKVAAALTAAQPALMIISTLAKPTVALSGIHQQAGAMGVTVTKPTTILSNDQPASTIASTLAKSTAALSATQKQSGTMGMTVTKPTITLTSVQQPTGTVTATASKVKATLAGASGSFVTRDPLTGNLMLDGARFMFAGSNINGLGITSYASMYGATIDAEGYHRASHSEIDDLLNQADSMNATVIRAYAAVMSVGRLSAVQPTLGTFNAAALDGIDYALQQCAIRGIKIYFPLVDSYDYEPRGSFWYCTANGVTPDGNASQFYNLTNTAIVNSFKAHISFVLDHVNVYTGVAYKDDPTILCWETGNELHNGGWTETNVAWTDAISRHIKVTKGAKQLVMDGCAFNPTGDDGGHLEVDLPYIDIMTHHPYFSGALHPLTNSGEAAHAHGKAFVAGEFTWTGLNPSGGGNDWTLDQFIASAETSTFVDGDNFWQLFPLLVGVGGPSQFGLHFPGDNSDMTTRGNKLATHALAMPALGTVPAPVTFLTDNFIGTNGTALGSHTPDSGGTWSQQSGSTGVETIQSNRLYTTAGFTNYGVYDAIPQNANYDITLNIYFVSNVVGSEVWILGRMVNGASTSYELNLQCSSATAYILRIKRWLNGTSSDPFGGNMPISVAPTVGSTHTLTLRMRGNQISALWDGKINLRVNNGEIIAKGAAGLGQTSISSTTGMHIDSITATSPPPDDDQTIPVSFNPTRNPVVAIGDSITDNWSAFDYQPWMGSNYLPLLTVQTMQRMKYGGIYATGGIQSTKMRDIHIPQVLALNPPPGACILFCGTNDTGTPQPYWNLSYTKEVVKDMVRSLMNAGITPIMVAIPPHDDFPSYTPNSEAWNAFIKQYAIDHNLPLIDVDAAVTDPDNTWKAGYSTDGLHPNPIGYEAMVNQAIAQGIPNLFPINDPTLLTARTTGDLTNIINDGTLNLGMFTTDTNADGVSDGFTTSGQVLQRDITSGWAPGDQAVLSARVKTLNITSTGVQWTLIARCTVPGGFTYPQGSTTTTVDNGIVQWAFDANGLMYVEFKIPSGTTAIQLLAVLASGTPVFSRIAPSGGDALAGSWQRLRNTANSTQLDVGELTLRVVRGAALRPLTAALSGTQKQSGTIAAALRTPTALLTPPAFLTDSMTAGDGTALASHTGEAGATWTKHTGWTGDITINSNRAVGINNTEAHYYASGVPTSANYDVSATIFDVSNGTFTLAGVMGRMVVGTNTGYAAFANFDGSTARVYLKRFVNGTGTDMSSTVITTPTVGSSHTLILRMNGNSLSALWDGAVVVGPLTDTNISAAGRAGVIHSGAGSSSTAGWHIDSVTAT